MTGSGRSPAAALFVLLLLAALALNPGFVDNVDSRISMRTAERLLDAGTWSLGDVEGTYMASPEYGVRGPDGSYQSKFGAGVALLQVPFLVAGRTLLEGKVLDEAQAGEAGVAASSALWFALAGIALFRVLRRFASERTAMGGTLAWCLATYAVVYGKSSYLEMPLTAALLFAHDAALSCRDRAAAWRPALALGAACSAVLWIKVGGVVWLAGLPLLFLRGGGAAAAPGEGAGPSTLVRTSLRASVVFVPAAAALLLLNDSRFGHPLATGYGPAAWFGHPLLSGLAYLLVSERAGLLFHAPLAFAGLLALPMFTRRDRGAGFALAAASAASLVLHALWCSPEGGDVWGPRYLLPTSALLAVPAAVAAEALSARPAARFAAAAVVAAGAAFNAAPVLVSFHEIYTLRGTQGPLAVPSGPLVARILVEKARSADGAYDLARLGVGDGPWTPPGIQRGVALWPTRVAERAPSWGAASWCVCGALVIGAAATGVFLRRSLAGGRT